MLKRHNTFLFGCLLLFCGAHGNGESPPPAPALLKVTVSDRVADESLTARSYPGGSAVTLQVNNGQGVYLSREQGRPVSIRIWGAELELPSDQEIILLTPVLVNGQVQVEISQFRRSDNSSQQIRTTVSGPLDTWLPLVQTHRESRGRVYSSSPDAGLFVRVSR